MTISQYSEYKPVGIQFAITVSERRFKIQTVKAER